MTERFIILERSIEADELRDSSYFFVTFGAVITSINLLVAVLDTVYPYTAAALFAASTLMAYLVVPCMSCVSAFSTWDTGAELLQATSKERIRIALRDRHSAICTLAVLLLLVLSAAYVFIANMF